MSDGHSGEAMLSAEALRAQGDDVPKQRRPCRQQQPVVAEVDGFDTVQPAATSMGNGQKKITPQKLLCKFVYNIKHKDWAHRTNPKWTAMEEETQEKRHQPEHLHVALPGRDAAVDQQLRVTELLGPGQQLPQVVRLLSAATIR